MDARARCRVIRGGKGGPKLGLIEVALETSRLQKERDATRRLMTLARAGSPAMRALAQLDAELANRICDATAEVLESLQ